jgi:hypothetical protein
VKPPRRQPRPPQQQTDRQKRTEAYEAEWKKTHRQIASQKRRRDIRGQDVALGLEMAGQSTGDPRFHDALALWKSYGFDHEFQRNVAREESKAFGDPDDGYLAQVDFFHRQGQLENGKRHRLSILEACEYVVAKFRVPGKTFEHAVERLRKAYLVSDYYKEEIFGQKPDQQKSKT